MNAEKTGEQNHQLISFFFFVFCFGKFHFWGWRGSVFFSPFGNPVFGMDVLPGTIRDSTTRLFLTGPVVWDESLHRKG